MNFREHIFVINMMMVIEATKGRNVKTIKVIKVIDDMPSTCLCFFVGHLCCCSLRWRSDLAAFPPRCWSFLHWTARRRRRWHSLRVFSFGAGFLCWSLQANSVVLPHHHHIIRINFMLKSLCEFATTFWNMGLFAPSPLNIV